MKKALLAVITAVLVTGPLHAGAAPESSVEDIVPKVEQTASSPAPVVTKENPPAVPQAPVAPAKPVEPEKPATPAPEVKKEEPKKFLRDAITGAYVDTPSPKKEKPSLRDRVRVKMKD